MSRPRVRVDCLDDDVRELIHQVFGTAPNAYRNLGVGGVVGMDQFRRAWSGRSIEPRHRVAIEGGVKEFVERIAKRAMAS